MDDADQKLEIGDEPLRHRVRGAACSIYVKNAVTQNLLQAPNEQYYKLLDFAFSYCSEFYFVIRETVSINNSVLTVLKSLENFLISQSDETQWHGTMLYEDSAKVMRYRLTPKSLTILKRSANNLFSWVQPELPEDLCLIRDNDEPFLVTITHEKDGYLILSKEEKLKLKLKSTIPELKVKA